MKDKEQKIIEQRTIEASKKGLMGFSGKLGTILRYLGQPILTHSTGVWSEEMGYSANSLDEYLGYKIEDDESNEIETMEVLDELGNPIESPSSSEWGTPKTRKSYSVERIGWYFYPLSSGINLEIKYIEDRKELIVNYQGYLVYKETGGELRAYVPSEDWEKHVDTLFRSAKKKEDQARKKEKEEKVIKAQKNKEKWLDTMRKFWGI